MRIMFDGENIEAVAKIASEILEYVPSAKVVEFKSMIDLLDLLHTQLKLANSNGQTDKDEVSRQIQSILTKGITASVKVFKSEPDKYADIFQIGSPFHYIFRKDMNLQPFSIYNILRHIEDVYLPSEKFMLLLDDDASDNWYQLCKLLQEDTRKKYKVQLFSMEKYEEMKEMIRHKVISNAYCKSLAVLDLDDVIVNFHKGPRSKTIKKFGTPFLCEKYVEKGKFQKNVDAILGIIKDRGFIPTETSFVILSARNSEDEWDRAVVEYVGRILTEELINRGWINNGEKVEAMANTTHNVLGAGTFFKSYGLNLIHRRLVELYGDCTRMLFIDDRKKYVDTCAKTVNLHLHEDPEIAKNLEQEVALKKVDINGKIAYVLSIGERSK